MEQDTFCRKEKQLLIDACLVPALQEALSEHMIPDKHNKNGEPTRYAIFILTTAPTAQRSTATF